MKYQKIRNNLKTGDVFFTSENSLLSNIIRFFTRSKVSHSGMFFWLDNRLYVFEMTTRGFNTHLASKYLENAFGNNVNVYYGSIRHNKTSDEIIDMIDSLSFTKYDMVGAIASIFSVVENKKMFCSEAVASVLGLKRKTSSRGFTPDDLAEMVDELKEITCL